MAASAIRLSLFHLVTTTTICSDEAQGDEPGPGGQANEVKQRYSAKWRIYQAAGGV